MTEVNDRALVAETKALIQEVERGDTAHAAWVAIQDRVQQLYEGRTQREVAELVGKDAAWVNRVLHWDRVEAAEQPTPWGGPAERTRRDVVAAKKVIQTEPQTIAKQIAEAPKEQRKQIIESLAEDRVAEDEMAIAAAQAEMKRQQKDRAKPPHKLHRKGALDSWGAIVSRGSSVEFQARRALEEWRSADEPIPEDLREDAEKSWEAALASCELVLATIKGESVGDQAEAFLADHSE